MARRLGLPRGLPQIATGLSTRLLILTALFVMISEALIYVPSIANYWWRYLYDRLATAHLAALALEATPDYMVSADLSRELLAHANAHLVVMIEPNGVKRILTLTTPPTADVFLDLEMIDVMGIVVHAFETMLQTHNRVLRVIGPSPKDSSILIEILIDETPMRRAMYRYSWNILGLSVVISLITAALVFSALQWLMVRPVRRLTEAMVTFREAPEDPGRQVVPGRRRDEIGVAERELAAMQEQIRTALSQKARLAALGGAMARINHDLRNILSTASLLSDRISTSSDPTVRRVAPTLVNAIDRAVTLCLRTLDFARSGTPIVRPDHFDLKTLVEEVFAVALAGADGVSCANKVEPGFVLKADRQQLDRVMTNLVKNAVQAGAHEICVSARHENGAVEIDVTDDGPGLDEKATTSLFQPFSGSTRKGGAGLGLAIAREIMAAHGGEIVLLKTDATGTTFRLKIPDERQVCA